MYHRKMIIGFLVDSNISPEDQDAIRVRLGKHVHGDGKIMAACLLDIFLSHELVDQFTAAWEANPGAFMEMMDS
jgi:hypothetical protein